MLAGEGQYQELDFDPAVHAQASVAAKKASYNLPSTGRQTEDLSKKKKNQAGTR